MCIRFYNKVNYGLFYAGNELFREKRNCLNATDLVSDSSYVDG